MLTETLKAIVAAAEGFEGAGLSRSSERNEGLKQRMAAALEQFQAAAGHVGTALDTLARNGNQVGSTLQNAADTLARQDGVAKVLRRAAGELAATADNLVARAQDETMARQRIAAMTRGLYTMAQEREIHAAVLGGGEATLNAAATAPPASVESLVDDILF